MVVAIPFSLGAAIYIAEFSTGKTRETLKVLVELLAAIPSVVWGFIGLAIMNPLIIDLFDVPIGLNVLNAGVILGLMAAPIMTSIAEDALKAVPDRYREAAEAMGATRWQIVCKVVLPAAKNGLLGAVLLGVGRGFGETMAVLMATGHSINLPTSVFDSVRALTATIAAELGETAVGSDHYQALFTIGIFLFVVTFIINLCIINLAGVPSIVHALFGVGAFVIFFGFGTSILAASLTLGIMTLPVVIVATRESLQAVPLAFREACWNMGATRWQTIRRVVLPNAVSGILTGVILEVSRTTGETAPIMFTGAAFFLPFLPQGIFDQTMALSLHLFVVSTQVPGVPEALPYSVALVLIAMVLLMNSLSSASSCCSER